MLTAEACIETHRASRYLVQLCEHLNQIGSHHAHQPGAHGGAPPSVERVEWSREQGLLTFDRGRCALHATEDTLTLHAEAADTDSLQRMKDMLAMRLETIGRRDQLKVSW